MSAKDNITVYPDAGFNSYDEVTNCDTYMENSSHGGAWTGYTDDQKARNMMTAFAVLERLRWKGSKTVSGQAGALPRTGLTNIDGEALSSTAIPQAVKDAQCELALSIGANSGVVTGSGTSENVKSIAGDLTRVEFFKPESFSAAGELPKTVQDLIGHLLASAGVARAITYGTSTDDHPSQFEERDVNDKNEPFG